MSSPSAERTSHPRTKATKVFKGHTDFVESVIYFPDGRHMASGSWDKTIRIWNVESGQQVGESLEHDSKVKAIAVSPDGGKIAGRVEGGVIMWDVVGRKRVREVKIDGHEEQGAYALMVSFSPNGRWIATASSDSTSIQLWDVDTGRPVRELQQHVDVIWCLSFSPDGAHIAAGSFVGSFRVLDISTGNTVVGPIQGHADAVTSLVYSPDSRLLVTGSYDKSIRVWDAATGREVGRPMLPRSAIQCIAMSADGKRIASASSDQTVRLWNLETRLQVGDPFAGRAWKPCAALSPNGRFVISAGTRGVYLCNTAPVLANTDNARSIVPSAHVATHPSPSFLQQKQTPSKAHRDTSLSSSILDLPAVSQPKPEGLIEVARALSGDDWDSFQPHRRHTTEPPETEQEPQAERENSNNQPPAAESGNQWTRIVRRRWRHLRSRKPRAHVEAPQDSPHSPLEEHPAPRENLDLEPATGHSILPTRISYADTEAPAGHLDAPEGPYARPGAKGMLSRLWARFRGTNTRPTGSVETQPLCSATFTGTTTPRRKRYCWTPFRAPHGSTGTDWKS